MKRISLLSISLVLLITLSTQGSDYYHIPLKERPHWSPYSQSLVSGYVEYNPHALAYGKNGLINYRYEYNPYALRYNSSGLVDRDVEYSPYALSPYNSGLISRTSSEFFGMYRRSGTVMNIINSNSSTSSNDKTTSFYEYKRLTAEESAKARKASLENQKANLEKIQEQKAKDPSEAIREFLKSKNIEFTTSRSLRIDGETISVNFSIENSDMIIKFWNSKAISEFIENDSYNNKIFENYLKSWEEYRLNTLGNSKQVFNIFASDREELLVQLASSNNFENGNALYASAQN